ncbi:MAG: cobalamin B12-binding domain-containing protein [Halanaerobiaceae bacterium]
MTKFIKKKVYKKAGELPEIPPAVVEEYKNNILSLISLVNDYMTKRDDIKELIGYNPLEVMYNNHENHVRFMVNVFKIGDYKLLIRTVIWVYRTYVLKGFSYQYFPVELNAWIKAVKKSLNEEKAKPVIKVYDWLIDNHEKFVALSQTEEKSKIEISEKWQDTYELFFQGLLNGNHKKCLELAKKKVNSSRELIEFFEKIVQPALYNIGLLWENGDISVAEEHLASSIVSRIISSFYSMFLVDKITRGKTIITAIANEYHEIGARLIADALEYKGWDVEYLGANIPKKDLIDILLKIRPFFLGLSVTLPFNIENAIDTITEIRSIPELKDINILIGGKVFNENPELWKKTGADAWAADTREAKIIAEKWWQEQKGD